MFDIGVNLTSNQFVKDHRLVVQRAIEVGISGLLITGTTVLDSKQAQVLAAENEGFCWSTAGVHPHYANEWSIETVAALRSLASNAQVIAIGECGLDFNRNLSVPEQQIRVFEAQLELACELQLPVFLHCREAHSRFMKIVKRWMPQLRGAVIHCFTGTLEELNECLATGLYIGITGWVCDERRGLRQRALLPHIPLNRLLLETDAPYLLPRDICPRPNSHRNEPCFLPHIVQQVARWRGEEAEMLAQITEENTRRLFQI